MANWVATGWELSASEFKGSKNISSVQRQLESQLLGVFSDSYKN